MLIEAIAPHTKGKELPEQTSKALCAVVGTILLFLSAFKTIERFPEYTGPLLRWTSVQAISGPIEEIYNDSTFVVNGVSIKLGSISCSKGVIKKVKRAVARLQESVHSSETVCYLNGRVMAGAYVGSCKINDFNISSILLKAKLCSRVW